MIRPALLVVPWIASAAHRRWSEDALASVRCSTPLDRLAVVNALRPGTDDESWLRERFDLVEHNDRNVLARAWNRGIRRALERGASHVIVMNLDLILHPRCLDNLLASAIERPDLLVWGATEWRSPLTFPLAELKPAWEGTPHWSCFMVARRLLETVGEFDEQFVPAYYEDKDMLRRIFLAGGAVGNRTDALFLHQERGSIMGLLDAPAAEVEARVALMRTFRAQIADNEVRYIRKWGGPPGEESFSAPYAGR